MAWDPKTFDKVTLTSGPYSAQQFLGVFASNAEVTGMKAAKGSVAFSTETDDGRLYIYDGSAWKFINANG
jgi:hypothetical protein